MDSQQILICGILILGCAGAYLFQTLRSPRRLKPGEKPQDVVELEVELRMAPAAQKLDTMRRLASAYLRHRDRYAAENTLISAIKLAENMEGKSTPTLVPILRDYARILRSSGRGAEAGKLEERAKEIEKKQS